MSPEEKLTAYALRELNEDVELSAAERAEVAAIEAVAHALSGEFADDPSEGLTAEQREAVEAAAAPPSARELIPYALAASIGAAALVVGFSTMTLSAEPDPVVAPAHHASYFAEGEQVEPPLALKELEFLPSVDREIDTPPAAKNAEGLAAPEFDYLSNVNRDSAEPMRKKIRKKGRKLSQEASRSLAGDGQTQPTLEDDRRSGALNGLPSLSSEIKDELGVLGRFQSSEQVDALIPSTFSIDVDTAAYSNVRSYLNRGTLPPAEVVRLEELINYFGYDDPPPEEEPFSVRVEFGDCPWADDARLARIGIKGRTVPASERPASNLVFLIDVSGSMQHPDKLPLLTRSLRLLVDQLGRDDRIAIVVYAGASGQVLPSTPGDNKAAIITALARLKAGGGTNGGAGIERAYAVAAQHFIPGGINRVVLATDGDFNVGITSRDALTELIQRKAKAGVELSVLGFGAGNSGDATMEELSNKGNGNYAYIDSAEEAKRVLVDQVGGTLVTIAKDVKFQTLFNAATVKHYRLIGYDNRRLATRDFDDDRKDAGEIGAGHTLTALYEYRLRDEPKASDASHTFQLKLRYKRPGEDESVLVVRDETDDGSSAGQDLQWAQAVAAFGMLLRGDEGAPSWRSVYDDAVAARGRDLQGRRTEFINLIARAWALTGGDVDERPPPSRVTPPAAPVTEPAPPPEPETVPFMLVWWLVSVCFSLVVGPLAWLKGARIRARYRHLGVPPAALPTAAQILGFVTTLLAGGVAALLLFA